MSFEAGQTVERVTDITMFKKVITGMTRKMDLNIAYIISATLTTVVINTIIIIIITMISITDT